MRSSKRLINDCIIALKDKENSELSYILKDENWALVTINNYNILAFYGTDTTIEWVDNLNFLTRNPEGFPLGWATEAFTALFKVAKYHIDYITGYSRGAAIALICSYYVPSKCLAFNCPRISYDLLYWKVTPLLIHAVNDPLLNFPIGYYHPGNYIQMAISKGGHSLKINNFHEEFYKALND